jgi:berberine-like enzyme
MAPLRRIGRPIADAVTPIPYVALQSMLDGGAPPGRHYYWKSHRLPGIPDGVVDALMEHLESVPTPFSQLNGWIMGGAVSRADAQATAVGEREVGLDISLAVGWQPGDPDADGHRAWARAGWEALRPYSAGIYANFISDEGESGVEAAYGDRRARLEALKAAWDPDNVFRMNANITPSVEVVR